MRILLLQGKQAQSSVRLCSIDSIDRIDRDSLAVSVNVTQETSILLLVTERDLQRLKAHFVESVRSISENREPEEFMKEELLLAGGE